LRIDGKKYSVVSGDDYLKEHVKNGFEPAMVKAFKTLINPTDIVLDIGANVGCTSILFGELAKQVYSFEPSPTTFSYLEKNIVQSGLKNVELLNMGLGSKSGESTITFNPENRSGGFVSNLTHISKGHKTEKIVIKTVDEIIETLKLPKIDFIKMDVEGFEGHVIQGAKSSLEKNKPIVLLELNHWCLNAFQRTSIPDFFDLLRSNFPILYALEGNTYMNLHDENDTYFVMYNHILFLKYGNIVAAYDDKQLERFLTLYQHKEFRKVGKIERIIRKIF